MANLSVDIREKTKDEIVRRARAENITIKELVLRALRLKDE